MFMGTWLLFYYRLIQPQVQSGIDCTNKSVFEYFVEKNLGRKDMVHAAEVGSVSVDIKANNSLWLWVL